MRRFHPAGLSAVLAAIAVSLQDHPPQHGPSLRIPPPARQGLTAAVWVALPVAAPMLPAPNARAAATSSLAVLLVPRFTSRTFPWSSFLTIATAREAASNGRESAATAMGPSFASFRNARMSKAASDHRVTLGSTGQAPPMASCISANRKRSQITCAGLPHAARTESHNAEGGWTRRPSATINAPDSASLA